MNRQIKFRGKRIDGGEWSYGCYVYTLDPKKREGIIREAYIKEPLGYFGAYHEVVPETVGQFTGLLDKNGKEVYEGDIIAGRAIVGEGGFEYTGQIVFYTCNECIGWHVEDTEGRAWDLRQIHTHISLDHITGEIIGNIHGSTELLKTIE